MTVKYTTVAKFWKFLGVNKNIMFAQPGTTPSRETVTTAPIAATVYYLSNPGVNPDTLALYPGSSTTPLTLNTDYTFDSDTNAITITGTGASVVGSTNSLTAGYQYSLLADVMNYDETVATLEAAESDFENDTNCVFANQGSTNPGYLQIEDEAATSLGWNNNIYSTQFFPLVKLQTATNVAYITGGTTLSVASTSGFPARGTICVGTTAVSYTSYSGNVLTIPSVTSTIASGSTVRGELVQVDLGAPGSTPAFQVLNPDTDYAIDYDTGAIQILGDLYLNLQYAASRATPGYLDRLRFTYMHAWHEPGQECNIPSDVVQAVHYKAAQDVQMRTVLKAGVNALENFNPNTLRTMDDFVKQKVNSHRCIRISRC